MKLRRSRRGARAALVRAAFVGTALATLCPLGCAEKKTNLPFVIPATPDAIVSGRVVLFYSVQDVKGQNVQALFYVSQDGGATYVPATPAPGQPLTPIVEAHPAGAPYFFYWDSVADLGPGFHRNVIVRALGLGGGASGRGVNSNAFFVDNSDIFVTPKIPGPSLARSNVVASALPDGTVYVAGGIENGTITPQGEVYDPVTDSTVAVPGLSQARVAIASALLANGQVLMAGGTALVTSAALPVADLYSKATNTTVAVAGGLAVARYDAAAAPLPGGDGLVVGGVGPGGTLVAEIERFTPAANGGAFSVVASSPLAAVERPTATALADGRVLVAGGAGPNAQAVSSAFLFDPTTSSVVPVGGMRVARVGHRATLLSNGKVLVTGGSESLLPNTATLATTEIFDPATLAFTSAQSMKLARAFHGQDLAGGRVLVAGGEGSGELTGTAEEYDQDLNLWRFTSFAPVSARSQAEVVATGPGRAVVAGGGSPIEIHHPLNLPPPEAWLSLESTPLGRADHTATSIFENDVLIVGGTTGISSATTSVERFFGSTNLFAQNQVQDQFVAVAGLNTGRAQHAACQLPNGEILVAGGHDANGAVLGSIEVYNGLLDTWTTRNSSLAIPRLNAKAIVVATGDVLVLGGTDSQGLPVPTTELYHWPEDTIESGAVMEVARSDFDAVEAFNRTIVVAGGLGADRVPSSAVEIYSPFQRSFVLAPPLQEPRSGLVVGIDVTTVNLIVTGGVGTTGTTRADFESYDPGAPASLPGLFPLDRARAFHTGIRLDDGSLLLAGGLDGELVLDSAGIYFQGNTFTITDPATGTERATISPRMNSPRYRHTATALPDGRVLIVGGLDARGTVIAGAEYFLEPARFFGFPSNPLEPQLAVGPPFPATVTSFPSGDGFFPSPALIPAFPPGTPTFP